ncbi:hypothetical protein [Trabulsiella odontotermitis]|uniref:hypothetical protein n=1 Tax=Trabulsiella odontotermitis TaxID=379893 RepID=UPI0006BA602D|nr:hypothetical protein [Trabulsiella odontotermitis]
MLNLVLFLLVVLPVIIIIKVLNPDMRAAKVIGFITLVFLVLCLAGYGVLMYNKNQQDVVYIEKLKAYSTALDDYTENHGYTVSEILADTSGKFDEPEKDYFRKQISVIDPDKKIAPISEVVAFANHYRSENRIRTGSTYIDANSRAKRATRLSMPLDDVSDVVIMFNPYFVDAGDAEKLVEHGQYDAWMYGLYSADGTKVYTSKSGWQSATEREKNMFYNAKN